MNCKNCGTTINNESSNFCPKCGAKIIKEELPKKKKEKNSNKKAIIILSSIIVLIGLTVFYYLLFVKGKADTKQEEQFVEENIISEFDTGTYIDEKNSKYLFGIDKNVSFKIMTDENFSYELKDSHDEKIILKEEKNDNILTLLPPDDYYKDGEKYTLKLINGKFVDEELSNSKEISFKINRQSKNTYTLKDNIEKITIESVNNNILTSTKAHNIGDVVIVENNGNLQSAYKIKSKNTDGTYVLERPELTEVFSEYDYYKKEKVDVSNIELQQDLKQYILNETAKNITDYFIENVYAVPKITINVKDYDAEKGRIGYVLKASTSAGDKLFDRDFLKHHDMTLELGIDFDLETYVDVELFDHTDIGVIINVDTSIKLTLDHQNKYFKAVKDFAKSKNKNLLDLSKVKELETENDENLFYDKDLAKIAIPTQIPGLYAAFNIDLTFELNPKVSLEVSNSKKMDLTVGMSSSEGLYALYNSEDNTSASLTGSIEGKIGVALKAGVEFLEIASVKVNVGAGPYVKGSMKLKTDVTNTQGTKKEEETIKSTLKIGTEAGIYILVKGEGKLVENMSITKTFYDNKIKCFNKEVEYVLYDSTEEKENKNNEKEKNETVITNDSYLTCKTGNCHKLSIYTIGESTTSLMDVVKTTYLIDDGTVIDIKKLMSSINKALGYDLITTNGTDFQITFGGYTIDFAWYYHGTDTKFDWNKPITSDVDIEMKMLGGLLSNDFFKDISEMFNY